MLCASILSGCSHADAQHGANTADDVMTGGALILLLGAVVILGAGALIAAAIDSAQDDGAESPRPAGAEAGAAGAGTYTASDDNWSVRVRFSGADFEGTAFCKATGTPFLFSGSIQSDGTVKGTGRGRLARTSGYEDSVPFAVTGAWPAIQLNPSRPCGASGLPLQLT